MEKVDFIELCHDATKTKRAFFVFAAPKFARLKEMSYICSLKVCHNRTRRRQMEVRLEDKIGYIIAVVSEFAARFSLNSQQAYRYLDRFKGIDFVDKFYNVEHTQSFEDVVEDLAMICRKNGGALA